MPVNHHGGSAGPPRGPDQEDIVMFLLEVTWWSHNVLTNLIVGGALDRHPDLQFVFTEQGTAWVPDFLGIPRLLLRPHAQRGRFAGARVGPPHRREDGAATQRVLGPPVPRRGELHPAVRGADPGAGRCRPDHVGERLPAQGVEPPVLEGGDPAQLRRRRSRRGAEDARRQRGGALRVRPRRARARSARGSAPSSERSPGRCRRTTSPRGRRSARRSRTPRSPCSEFSTTRGTTCRSTSAAASTARSIRSIRAAASGRSCPTAFERHQDLLADAVRVFAPAPLVVEIDGDAWTLAVDGGRVHVRDGGDDAPGVVLRTNPAQLDDLVTDQVTVVGMQTNGTLDQPVGRFDALLDWWLLLRGALDARAPHVPGAIDARRRQRRAARARPQLPGRCPPRRDGRLPPARRVPPHRGRVLRGRDGSGVARHGPRRTDVHARGRTLVVGAEP